MKFIKWLDKHFEESLMAILLIIICVVEMLQVLCRKLPFIPTFSWTDELNRFCWIWTVFLSIPYTIRNMNMLRVNIIMDKFPSIVRNIWNILVDLVNAAVYGFLFYNSIEVISNRIASGETSPAMEWPIWIIYAIMLVGFGLGCFRAIQVAVIHAMHINEKQLSTTEQTLADAQEEIEAGLRAESNGEAAEGGTN